LGFGWESAMGIGPFSWEEESGHEEAGMVYIHTTYMQSREVKSSL
jgi:hypothetical protein